MNQPLKSLVNLGNPTLIGINKVPLAAPAHYFVWGAIPCMSLPGQLLPFGAESIKELDLSSKCQGAVFHH